MSKIRIVIKLKKIVIVYETMVLSEKTPIVSSLVFPTSGKNNYRPWWNPIVISGSGKTCLTQSFPYEVSMSLCLFMLQCIEAADLQIIVKYFPVTIAFLL